MLMTMIATPPGDSRDGTMPARARWAPPAVRRLVAGAAEDGASSSPDSGVNPS